MEENKTFDKQFWKWFRPFLIFIGVIFLFPLLFTQFNLLDLTKTGQIGDTIGGTMGPFVAIAAAILTFMAFWVQYKANEQLKRDLEEQKERVKKESFESIFFELVRLYRDNVNDLRYTIFRNNKEETFENREVMREIFFEFIDCFKEVKKISKKNTIENYFIDDYKKILEDIIRRNNITVDITNLALIDIAYSIVFFGVENDGETVLLERFEKKYNKDFYSRILKNIKLKPKQKEVGYYIVWSELNKKTQEDIDKLLEIDMDALNLEILRSSKKLKGNENLSLLIDKFTKFYDGHQQRLGHYFRHLFQTYKFLDQINYLDFETKYFFGKTLRAQFSTYEQSLLFINSVSTLGVKWEYDFDSDKTSKLNKKSKDVKYSKSGKKIDLEDYEGFITKYQLIKNLPGSHLSGIIYKDYYPNVKYENSE